MTIWSILRPLETFYGHLVYFVVIWYIFPRFGILDQEKSGNPVQDSGTNAKIFGFFSLSVASLYRYIGEKVFGNTH
jgi:hypothetical protein